MAGTTLISHNIKTTVKGWEWSVGCGVIQQKSYCSTNCWKMCCWLWLIIRSMLCLRLCSCRLLRVPMLTPLSLQWERFRNGLKSMTKNSRWCCGSSDHNLTKDLSDVLEQAWWNVCWAGKVSIKFSDDKLVGECLIKVFQTCHFYFSGLLCDHFRYSTATVPW